MEFELVSDYRPTGDQPEAIAELADGVRQGLPYQTLLGVTGSGKTFTIANVINELRRPALVLSHNKTLAAQLYSEFKGFFPNNAVEYFVSYYDYYQPEAYIPSTNTYIEKDLSINKEIDKLRLRATSALLSGRRDVIIVSSVSCLYGIGNPDDFRKNVITLERGVTMGRDFFLRRLVDVLYSRNQVEFERGRFRVMGDTVDVYLAYDDVAVRVVFWGDQIEEVSTFDPVAGNTVGVFDSYNIYPANIFVTTPERIVSAVGRIRDDMEERVGFFTDIGRHEEACRLRERVLYDLEMIRELGYCSGIENYSRYFDGRLPGTRPYTLIDYFPDDFITVIDESHVTIPQIRAMYGGDRSRKLNLVEYGFRLPAAIDNRPMRFEEFDAATSVKIFVSATPADYELDVCRGVFTEQVIRPTGLLDPEIEVRPSLNQIDDLMEEIAVRCERGERTLVTTLTKRMAEELHSYLSGLGVKSSYIHSDVETLDRIEIMDKLRQGVFDVLIGVNLLREGLDFPEVSLVAILDADKEGFLRSDRSLTQTAGRAARNVNGRVIFYADTITESMRMTIDRTGQRRERQVRYNAEHNITPRQIAKHAPSSLLLKDRSLESGLSAKSALSASDVLSGIRYDTEEELRNAVSNMKRLMLQSARSLDFIQAAQYRDEMMKLEAMLLNRGQKETQ
ncbi:MAG: excinuclease ABC subunit UvrB [Dysgonamonadaceae bacterium]|jgi:excinuclease ABC subunit B|nr:excinuclease ABC subunit UvrB [Dysgonamonadaceae bacterium]